MSRKQIETITDDATLLAEIVEAQEYVDKLAVIVDEKKEALKEAKDEWKQAVAHLGAIIRDRKDRPLLNGDNQ